MSLLLSLGGVSKILKIEKQMKYTALCIRRIGLAEPMRLFIGGIVARYHKRDALLSSLSGHCPPTHCELLFVLTQVSSCTKLH